MTFRAQTLVCLAFCLVGFFAGWWVNGLRSDAIIAKQEQSWSDAIALASKQAMDRYESMEKTKDEAIKAAQERATKAEADAGRAAATVDSLRKQISSVPARIATASRSNRLTKSALSRNSSFSTFMATTRFVRSVCAL